MSTALVPAPAWWRLGPEAPQHRLRVWTPLDIPGMWLVETDCLLHIVLGAYDAPGELTVTDGFANPAPGLTCRTCDPPRTLAHSPIRPSPVPPGPRWTARGRRLHPALFATPEQAEAAAQANVEPLPAPEENRGYRTPGGRILTNADIEELAAEAERGYDVSKLRPAPTAAELEHARRITALIAATGDPTYAYERCHGGRDGDCHWPACPQELNGRAHYQSFCPLAEPLGPEE